MTNEAHLLSDAEIIRRILSGEVVLFELLIKRNNAILYKTGMSYGFNHHDVEDLMQEAYISAYTNLSKFENRSSFRTWLVRIMLNQCHHRTKKFSYIKEQPTELSERENVIPMFSSHSDTSKSILNREINNIIQNAITRIPVEYRMVFSLREVSGFSVAETAEALDITPSNVKVRLNRARTMLRKEIEQIYKGENLFEYNLIYCDRMAEKVMGIINRMN
jgi:RNA polymerase sigma-70 factor (ECF subfamily)